MRRYYTRHSTYKSTKHTPQRKEHTSAHSEHTCTHSEHTCAHRCTQIHKRTHCISPRAGWQPPLQRCTAHYCQAQSIINARHIHKCLITLWSLSFNCSPHCGQNQFETPVIFVRWWTWTTVCGRTQNAKLLFPATLIITSAATCLRKYNWLHSSGYLLDHSPGIALPIIFGLNLNRRPLKVDQIELTGRPHG